MAVLFYAYKKQRRNFKVRLFLIQTFCFIFSLIGFPQFFDPAGLQRTCPAPSGILHIPVLPKQIRFYIPQRLPAAKDNRRVKYVCCTTAIFLLPPSGRFIECERATALLGYRPLNCPPTRTGGIVNNGSVLPVHLAF